MLSIRRTEVNRMGTDGHGVVSLVCDWSGRSRKPARQPQYQMGGQRRILIAGLALGSAIPLSRSTEKMRGRSGISSPLAMHRRVVSFSRGSAHRSFVRIYLRRVPNDAALYREVQDLPAGDDVPSTMLDRPAWERAGGSSAKNGTRGRNSSGPYGVCMRIQISEYAPMPARNSAAPRKTRLPFPLPRWFNRMPLQDIDRGPGRFG